MKIKLTDIEKLKYWLDAELSVLHIFLTIIIWLLTHNIVVHVLLAIYLAITVLYTLIRIFYLGGHDQHYLKLK